MRVLHTSPAGSRQPSHTLLTFGADLVGAPYASIVSHHHHHHHLLALGRRRRRVWLAPHRFRAPLALRPLLHVAVGGFGGVCAGPAGAAAPRLWPRGWAYATPSGGLKPRRHSGAAVRRRDERRNDESGTATALAEATASRPSPAPPPPPPLPLVSPPPTSPPSPPAPPVLALCRSCLCAVDVPDPRRCGCCCGRVLVAQVA